MRQQAGVFGGKARLILAGTGQRGFGSVELGLGRLFFLKLAVDDAARNEGLFAQFDITFGIAAGETESNLRVALLCFGSGDSAARSGQCRASCGRALIKVDGVHLGQHLPGFYGVADIHGNALHTAGDGWPDLVTAPGLDGANAE